MSDPPLKDMIVAAFQNLGGRAHLSAVYEEVRRLGYVGGGEDPDKIIRSAIQKHSRHSRRFTGKSADDLFRHVGPERSGIWELSGQRAGNGGRLPDEEADRVGSSEDVDFVPQQGDRRKVVERQIRERRGQQQFRDALRERYGDRCLVTGCEVLAVLEAAHISPYRGDGDNHPANGLLLRADIHTLFDLDLLAIDPEGLRLELHPDVEREYGFLAGVTLRCGGDRRPATEALRLRHEQFRRRLDGSPQ